MKTPTPFRVRAPGPSQGQDTAIASPTPRSIPLAIIWAIALVVLLIGSILVIRPRQPEQPVCSDRAEQIAEVEELVRQGKYVLAAERTNACLADGQPIVCPQARGKLAILGYSATVQDILTSPVADEGHLATLRWLEAERWASAYGVPESRRVSPMSIALQARSSGAWELGRVAFIRAWQDRLVTIHDRGAVAQYYAILARWGHDLALKDLAESRERGIRLLATAHALAAVCHLPYDEACRSLQALGYPHCSQVQPDFLDPVLAAASE